MSSTTLLRKAGLRTVASGRRTDSGKTSFVNSDVRPFRLLDTLSDGNSDARARLRTCAAAPDPQASEKAGAPLPQQGNKLVQQELARLTTDQTGPATSAQFDGASIDGAPHDVAQHPVLQSRAGMRQLSGCDSAADCMAQFLELAEKQEAIAVLNEEDCISLISATISRGNFKLAKDVYQTMGRSNASAPSSLDAAAAMASTSDSQVWGFPAATLNSTQAMVLLLARELRVQDALDVVAAIRTRGMPAADEVPFGLVVSSPLAPDKPLTVVQPQEGRRVVACAESRYEFEVFSGTVVGKPNSEALNAGENFFKRLLGFGKGTCQATHEMLVRTPDGISRTFRFGTASSDVPAQEGERVTFITCPEASSTLRKQGILTSRPPGTKPGEPLVAVNHTLGARTQLLRPPSKAASALPQWLPVVLGTFAAAELGSGFFDPNLPVLIAGGLAVAGTSYLGGSQLLIPRLKQLADSSVAIEEVQQGLLERHSVLVERFRDLNTNIREDVRALARLWQLQVKMQSVGPGAYDQRLGRVVKARGLLEEQLRQRLVLLEGYSRISNMIEIEVEMNTSVPQSEIDDIESQIKDLMEVEEMQTEWELQAEAQDELERLLRTT